MGVYTQTTYPQSPPIGVPGEFCDTSRVRDRVTLAAAETLRVGKGLVYHEGSNKTKVRLPMRNKFTLVFGADIATGQTFAGTIAITPLGGSATATPISVAYSTSHLVTMQAIKAAFEAIANVTATISDANNRTLTIEVANNKALEATVAFAVTGGTPFTPTATYGSKDTLCGISGFDPNIEKTANDEVLFLEKDPVPVARKGRLYIQPGTALALTDTLRCRFTDGGTDLERGSFVNAAGSPVNALDVSGFDLLVPAAAAGDIAKVELLYPSIT